MPYIVSNCVFLNTCTFIYLFTNKSRFCTVNLSFTVLKCIHYRIHNMAKKKNRRTKSKQQSAPLFEDLSPHAKQGIAAISFTVLALFFIFSSLGFAGIAGDITQKVLESLFGVVGFVLAPILCFLFVYIFLKPKDDDHISPSKLIGAILLFLAILGLLTLLLKVVVLLVWVFRILLIPFLVHGLLAYYCLHLLLLESFLPSTPALRISFLNVLLRKMRMN